MSTHMPGLQSFFSFFASSCIGKISYQQHKGEQNVVSSYIDIKHVRWLFCFMCRDNTHNESQLQRIILYCDNFVC